MTKKELKEKIREGDEAIKAIREDQMKLVYNFAKTEYELETGDQITYKGMSLVVVGFDYEGVTCKIKIKYKKIKYTGTVSNIVYKMIYDKGIKAEGKYKYKY